MYSSTGKRLAKFQHFEVQAQLKVEGNQLFRAEYFFFRYYPTNAPEINIRQNGGVNWPEKAAHYQKLSRWARCEYPY